MKVWIHQMNSYLPPTEVTNDEIIKEQSLKIKSSWIERYIGIQTRRWALDHVAASDLAVKACEGLDLSTFQGPVFVSTISQDYFTPSTASIIKGKLGLKDDCPAIDLNAACAGQLFALDLAKSRLLTHEEETQALVIATEIRSRWLNKNDRRTVFLFGDGAVVFHLKKGNETDSIGHIEWCESKTIASDQFDILVPGGGSALPWHKMESSSLGYIKMNDGETIFKHTTESLIGLIEQMLSKHCQSLSDYQYFIFHQGNGAIIKKICDQLGIAQNKTLINFDRFGNTSSASMGIAFDQAIKEKKIKKGDRILTMAMGAGYHIGMSSIIWGE